MRKHIAPSVVVCIVLCFGARLVRADVYEEYAGARSVAMGGAHRGLGTSNDTLILNPAGMATTRRYSIDAAYSTGSDHINRLHLSAVDSKSSPVAAGVGYTRDFGNPSDVNAGINRVYVAAAYPLTRFLAVGLGAQNLRGELTQDQQRHKLSLYNGTVGVLLSLGQTLGVGASLENFIRLNSHHLMPMRLGLGASLRTQMIALAGDVRWDLAREEHHPVNFGIGGEFFLKQVFALRGGYRLGAVAPTFHGAPLDHFLSGGLALVTPHGGAQFSADYGLEKKSWRIAAGAQFFM